MMTTTKKKAAPAAETVAQEKTAALNKLGALNRKLTQLPTQSANLPATTATATPTEKDDKKHLDIVAQNGETDEQALTRARIHPVSTAAVTMLNFNPGLKTLGISAVVGEMTKHVNAVKAGVMTRPEAMLICQAQTLDTIFAEMAMRAAANMNAGHLNSTEQYLRMALKAQAQCRATIETLAEFKNPRQANFIKQQNVANQQQVNNGVPVPGNRAHAHGADNANRSNELLEGKRHGERMDTRAAGTAGSGDSQMEAVEKGDRSNVKRGKGNQQPKRAAARNAVG